MLTHPELLRDLKAVKAKIDRVEVELANVRDKQRPTILSGQSLPIDDLAALLGVKVGSVRKHHHRRGSYWIGAEEWRPTRLGSRLWYARVDKDGGER